MTEIHEEIYIERKGGAAVLFIHGILGSPNHFSFIMQALFQEVSCLSILLPGHGKTEKHFSAANMKQWQACVKQKLAFLRKRYDKIYIVTHSMGGLLAINEINDNCEKVQAIIALALPVYLKVSFTSIKNPLAVAFNRIRENDEVALSAKKACSVTCKSVFSYFSFLPRFLELMKIAKETRKLLKNTQVKTLYLMSKKDEVVRMGKLQTLKSPKDEIYVLQKSSHYFYEYSDKEVITEKIREFFSLEI